MRPCEFRVEGEIGGVPTIPPSPKIPTPQQDQSIASFRVPGYFRYVLLTWRWLILFAALVLGCVLSQMERAHGDFREAIRLVFQTNPPRLVLIGATILAFGAGYWRRHKNWHILREFEKKQG